MAMMITRDDAIDFLRGVIDDRALSNEACSIMDDIVACIELEKRGIHAWGMPSEDFSTMLMEYQVTDDRFNENAEEQANIRKKYGFTDNS